MSFSHVPIDLLSDDTIEINIEMVFHKNNGEIKNVSINNTYYQEYFEETVRSLLPLEKLPTEDEVRY